MTEAISRYHIDSSSHSCRIRIEGTKPGKQVKVLVKNGDHPRDPSLHGTGVLSDDATVFTVTFASTEGEQTLVLGWPALKAELARFPQYD